MAQPTETYRRAFVDCDHPHISYGLSFSDACAKHVEATFKASKIYIFASKSLANNTDAVKKLEGALGDKVVGVREGMKPHTLWSECIEVAKDAQEKGAGLLVTIGSGSLTDAAKMIILILTNNAFSHSAISAWGTSYNSRTDLSPPTVPIISIPTSLAGGEYSDFVGSTNDTTQHKHNFGPKPPMGPSLIILDAHLSASTPASLWLSTGVRAVDHCVETYTSAHADAAAFSDAAKAGLAKLVPGLLRSCADPEDAEARFACMLGVRDAMAAVKNNVPLGASHGIGHQLGPLGVGHGETSCILLPAVCRWNAAHAGEAEKGAEFVVGRQRELVEVLWGEKEVAKVLEQRGLKREDVGLGDVLEAVVGALGLPGRLRERGVPREKFEELASSAVKDKWCQTSVVPVTREEQVVEILELAR
ncbi:uncharacterized protein K452DRAFT_228075 [Aplosporella prunicola CBS 121167]|uniref:Uncharacterized protein n=1 Tax=Aplosporella prunicola CBS 121167 TaxID=1176127 RepID=A0A6A6BC48_9PEZI|nr:uncharacterized protein K452DRAFT_228075 [Aplosporella prunicola CBS 121167]KAF2141779.1 hypothetical protein K452DRAFT_228075 [Aplosporella prunicola CBS 121167]